MDTQLHPWLGTRDAYRACVKSVSIPMAKLPARSQMLGPDELLSEALSILTECALPPLERERALCANTDCNRIIPDDRRKGAKYCSERCNNVAGQRRARQRGKGFDAPAPPAPPKTHIGSMWSWPPENIEAYAIREVGYRLLNYVKQGHLETPSSQTLYNLAIADPEALESARDIAEAWLENRGVRCSGGESIAELTDAVGHILNGAIPEPA